MSAAVGVPDAGGDAAEVSRSRSSSGAESGAQLRPGSGSLSAFKAPLKSPKTTLKRRGLRAREEPQRERTARRALMTSLRRSFVDT